MSRRISRFLSIFAFSLIAFALFSFQGSAKDLSDELLSRVNETAVKAVDRALCPKLFAEIYNACAQCSAKNAGKLRDALDKAEDGSKSSTLQEKSCLTDYIESMALSPEEIDEISSEIADDADLYVVTTANGKKTVYIAVDLRTEEAGKLRNINVLRETSSKLLKKSEKIASRKSGSFEIMDYTHIVGEIKIHHDVFILTDSLGGEKLHGVLLKIYNSSKVADLNIDEQRIAIPIRLAGTIIG